MLSSLLGTAQVIPTSDLTKSLQIVESFLAKKQKDKAISQLLHSIRIAPESSIPYRLIGKLYFDEDKYDLAKSYLLQAVDKGPNLSRGVYFELGECYFYYGNIDSSRIFFSQYQKMKNAQYTNAHLESGLEVGYDKLMNLRESNFKFIEKADSNQLEFIHLSEGINTKYSEYLPSINTENNKLVFTRLQKTEDIWLAEKKDSSNIDWDKLEKLTKVIQTDANEGMAKFSGCDRSLVFTECSAESDQECIIKTVKWLKNNKLDTAKKIDDSVNSDFWDSQPSYSCDGQVLFFASQRPGGFGGSDIWVSYLNLKGEWGDPINLGPKINTKYDEESPFIAQDGKTLYFASNGHPGFGNGDIFVSYGMDNRWSKPINLGYPINTTGKEIGFSLDVSGKYGWLSSIRPENLGGLDIYKTEIPKDFQPFPTGTINIKIYDKFSNIGVYSKVIVGSNGERQTYWSDKEGNLTLCVKLKEGYSFRILSKGYGEKIEAFYLPFSKNPEVHQLNFFLD